MSTTMGPFAGRLQPPALTGSALPPRVREALQDVLSLLFDEVVRKLELALSDLEVQLQQRADKARNAAEHARASAALRRVQRNRDALAPRFLALLESDLAQLRNPRPALAPKPAVSAPVRFEDLRLVEHNEADEDTVLRAITLRHESRAGLPLQLLGQRFGVLAGRPAFDAQTLPVGPQRLAELLGEACDVMEIDIDVRLELLQLFDRQVLAQYEVLAELMNAALVKRNVLPTLSFVPLRRSPRARNEPPRVAAQAISPRAAAPVSAAEFDFLQQLLDRRRGVLGRMRSGTGAPQPAAVALETSEVLAALSALQAHPVPLAQVRATVQGPRAGIPGPAVMSRADSDALELLTLLYARLTREMREGSQGLELLERLQLPLLRAALVDHRFFTDAKHPARELLDRVAESGARWLADDDQDPQYLSALREAVDQVLRQFNGDMRVFALANQTAADAEQAIQRRAEVAERRQIETARGRERMSDAKQRAAAAIREEMQGVPLTRLVRSLLTQVWADVLTLTALRNPDDSEDWRMHRALTRDIVTAASRGGEGNATLATHVCEALRTVGYHDDEAAMIARRLAGMPEDDDDAASRTELAMRLKARARLGEEHVDEAPASAPLSPAEQFYYDDLVATPPGRWFEFDEEGQPTVRRRLAYVGPASGLAVLVNRRGQKVAELRLDELARKMAAESARPVETEHTGMVERAWQSTLSALRGFGGAPGADEDGE